MNRAQCVAVSECSGAYCAGERSFRIKTEDDSNDITEHPHDDKPRPDLYTVCDKRFTEKKVLSQTARRHTEDCLLYTSPSPRDRQKSRMPSSA